MQRLLRARAAFARATAMCVWVALAGHARAAEPAPAPDGGVAPELALTWQAPAGCPSSTDVQAQFARLLGGAARTPSGKRIEASALVRAAAVDRWSVELATVLDGAVGRRNLSGDSCASVTSAAALILALMIDPAAAERAAVAPTPAPHAPKKPEVVVTPPPSEPPPRTFHAMARLFGGAVFALLPAPAAAAGLAVGARHKRFGGELSFVATEVRREGAVSDSGGDFRLLAGGARACGRLGGRVVIWDVCLGGELERVTGTGLVSAVRTKTVLMGAGTGGLLVTVPFASRFGLSLDLDAAVRPYHPHFSDSGAPIFQIPAWSAFGAGGLFVTF